MVGPRVSGKLVTYGLTAIFCASAAAQSLGDLAREEKQKKASAQSGAASPRIFSNIDNPPLQATTPNGPPARRTMPAGESLLQINSPADGTVVSPGQTIRVRVTSPVGRVWSFVDVGTSIPNVLLTEPALSIPAEFSITIPSEIGLRRYTLTAMGRTAAGEFAESAPINIDVERPDMPVSRSQVNGDSQIFEAPGQPGRLLTLATFADGQVVDVSESSHLTFESTDKKIVTVDEAGAATSVATGTAAIIVSYTNPNGPARELRIPITVLRFELSLTPASLDFGNVRVGSSASLTVTATNKSMSVKIHAVNATAPYTETDNCVSSSPLALDASCQITVTFTPVAEGQSPRTLSIPNSSSSVPSLILLTGVGVK